MKRNSNEKANKGSGIWIGQLSILLVGCVLGIFTPVGQRLGHKLTALMFEPSISVTRANLLIHRQSQDGLVSGKIKLTFHCADSEARDIQLVYLRDSVSGDSVPLSSVEPMRVKELGFTVDSVEFVSVLLANVFRKIPRPGNQGWSIGYRVAGTDKMYTFSMSIERLRRLHYFIGPADQLYLDGKDRAQAVEFGDVRNLWSMDTLGVWRDEGRDSLAIFVYPSRYVDIGLDTDNDGYTDTILESSQVGDDAFDAVSASITEIIPNYLHYLDNYSGFVYGVSFGKKIPRAISISVPRMADSGVSERFFGSVIDMELPLGDRDFVYWEFSSFK